jgi:hypothetical protein
MPHDRAEVIARVAEDILLGRRVQTERHRELVAYLEDEIQNIIRETITDGSPPHK